MIVPLGRPSYGAASSRCVRSLRCIGSFGRTNDLTSFKKWVNLSTNAEGRPTQRFFSILLKRTVALGENAHHFCHVLSSPGTQRDNLVGQTAAERGERVVHARWHLLVVGPRQHSIGLQFLQLLDQHLGADAMDVALELAVD